MFRAAFVKFSSVSIFYLSSLFLRWCASPSVTSYLSVIFYTHIRSGFMCIDVRGYRDEMTLIGQSESVVCQEEKLGCDVKGQSSGDNDGQTEVQPCVCGLSTSDVSTV